MIRKSIHNLSEQQLIKRSIQQDRRAQQQLYQQYAGKLYNVAFRILGDAGLAEDALQEGFLAVFNGLSRFKEDSSLETWMRRIVVNKSIQLLKKEQRLPLSFDEMEMEVYEEDSELDYLTVEKIKNGIQSLPSGYKTILNLYLLEGYDHLEISQILNIAESTSKSQYHRGKKYLQKYIKQQK